MRKKQAKTIFILLVLMVIGSMILSACGPIDGDDLSGGAGGQGQGQGQDKDKDKDTGPDEDKDTGPDEDKDTGKDEDKDTGKDEDKDTGKDDTGGSGKTDEVIDDGPENDKGGGKNKKITLCHATGSETNPYVEITVADDGVYNGHIDHDGDIIPAPAGGCPKPEKTKTPKPPNEKITICHATGSEKNPYVVITVADDGVYNGHIDHANDIIPAPAEGCPTGPTPTPPPKEKVSLCHATSSEKNPYVFITVADDGAYNGHINHEDDIFDVTSAEDCPGGPTPTPTPTPEPGNTYICHATGDENAPYEVLEVPDDATLGGHTAHGEDIYPVPAEGCPGPIPKFPEPPETGEICINYIVFHSLREGNMEIYRLDGSEEDDNFELINLSQGPNSQELRPARSWNDSLVVFESTRDGNVELYLNSSGGGLPTRLTYSNSNNVNPIFVHGDESVLFQSDRNGSWDIFIINLESREERQLTSNTPFDEIFPFPSPYPEWITYQTNRNGNWDIYMLNIVTGVEQALATSSANETLPTWSSDGKSIAYISDYAGEQDLWIHNLETNAKQLITIGPGSTAFNPSWSPVGNRIAYQSNRDRNLDVYTYDVNERTEYRATTFEGVDTAPTWDCDGQRVSFTSLRDNDFNILEVFWQGGENFFLTNDPAVDKWSQWSPSKEQGSRTE
jgi:Tol biopolymer transport system component